MILTTIAIVAQASAAPSAAPTATPSAADLKVAATARAWFVSMQHGKVLDASQLEPAIAAALTPQVLSSFEAQLGPLGDPLTFDQDKSGPQNGGTYYIYDLTFKTGDRLKFAITFDAGGKISGLRALPPQ
jgi:hypothetical protein